MTWQELVIGLLSVLSVGSVIAQIAQWRMGGRQNVEVAKAAQEVSEKSAAVTETKELTETALGLVNELKLQLTGARNDLATALEQLNAARLQLDECSRETRLARQETEEIREQLDDFLRAARLEVSWAGRMREELLAAAQAWPVGLAREAPILTVFGDAA